MEHRAYVAFISYRHTEQDAAIAKAVHRSIEEYVIPRALRKDGKKKLGVVFRDEEELPVSSDLTESICRALDNARYLVVVCSEAARESQWVQREVQYFLQHHSRDDVFVVLAQGEPQNVFPEELTHVTDPQTGLEMSVEPLAIDARGINISISLKKLKKQIKKLFAAMLGCAYDTLVQREKRRRTRKMAFAGAAAGVVLLAFMGMLLMKNNQLAQKNTQLQEINQAVLLRESQLLSSNAREALLEQNLIGAVESAVSALPSAEEDRPYYAPAEAVLFQALDPFANNQENIQYITRSVTQTTPVAEFCLTEDGRYLLTMDEYGKIICYDSKNGAEKWIYDMSRDAKWFSQIGAKLVTVTPEGVVVGHFKEKLVGLQAESGQCLWEYKIEDLQEGFAVSPGKESISFLNRDNPYYGIDNTDAGYEVITLSAASGKEVSRAEVCHLEGGSNRNLEVPSSGIYGQYGKTLVYTDESTLMGMYVLKETAQDEDVLNLPQYVYFTVDTESGETGEVLRQEFTDQFISDRFMALLPVDEKQFLSVHYASATEKGVWLQLMDSEKGKVWESKLGEEGEFFFGSNVFVLPGINDLIVGAKDWMFQVDRHTGKKLAQVKLCDSLLSMFPVNRYLFGFVLRNGYYSVGWISEVGFRDAAAAQLGEIECAQISGNGFLHVPMEGNIVKSAQSLSPAAGGGKVAAMTEDEPYTVQLFSGMTMVQWPEETLQLDENGKMMSFNTASLHTVVNENTIALGSFPCYGEDDEMIYEMILLDTREHKVKARFWSELYFQDEDIYFLADGSGYIQDSDYQNTRLFRGEEADILRDETTPQTGGGGYASFAQQMVLIGKDGSGRLSDGTVLTARLGNGKMTFFHDGEYQRRVPLPQNVEQRLQDFIVTDGVVMVYLAGETDDIPVFALYWLEEDNWDYVTLTDADQQWYCAQVNAEKKRMAIHDGNGKLQIFSAKEGTLLAETETGITENAMGGLYFFHHGDYLLLHTRDGQMFVYDTNTLERVYRWHINGQAVSTNKPAFVMEDEKNARVYLASSGLAMCVDMRSWEEIFTQNNFLYFDKNTGEMYLSDFVYPDNMDRIRIVKVPTLEELVEKGRWMMEMNQ